MFLILTADPQFTELDQRETILGDWCHAGPNNAAGGDGPAEVLPYPFDDRQMLYDTYRYVDKVYGRLQPQLAAILNRLHGTEHSERFWAIITGYWFREYLEILFERYTCISQAHQTLGNAKVKLLDPFSYLIPEDSWDFEFRTRSDLLNHQFYSQIIDYLDIFDRSYVKLDGEAWRHKAPGFRAKIRNSVANLVKWASLLGSRWNSIYLSSTYFPLPTLFNIALRLKIFPTLDTPQIRFPALSGRDSRLANELAGMEVADDFEKLVRHTLQFNLPSVYVENHAALAKKVSRFFPKRARLILTANGFAVNEPFKLWTAQQTERHKTPYVILQHGGNYGCGLWNSSEDYEIAVADYYLTYGWTAPNRENVLPFYASRIPAPKTDDVTVNLEGDIIWVLMSTPRYSYSMYSGPAGAQYRNYLDEQGRFLNALVGGVRALVKCRPLTIDYGRSDMDHLRRVAGDFAIDEGSGPVFSKQRAARLFVIAYNATAHLETLALNLPTIIFWDPEYWEIRPAARPAMKALQDAGILYYTPEGAAQKIGEIYQNTLAWWSQPEIQAARKLFCEQYARTTRDQVGIWTNWIRDHATPD